MSTVETTIDEHGRPEPPLAAGEAQTLLGFLDFQRATLAWKVRGVDEAGLRRSLAGHPSGMTLAGLLKHVAYVEDYWFSEVVGGTEVEPWSSVDWESDPDWEWASAAADSGAELHDLWESSIERSRAVTATRLEDLGATSPAWGGQAQVSLRWVLTHMVEEYARHNGHADLLREQIDGEVGE